MSRFHPCQTKRRPCQTKRHPCQTKEHPCQMKCLPFRIAGDAAVPTILGESIQGGSRMQGVRETCAQTLMLQHQSILSHRCSAISGSWARTQCGGLAELNQRESGNDERKMLELHCSVEWISRWSYRLVVSCSDGINYEIVYYVGSMLYSGINRHSHLWSS